MTTQHRKKNRGTMMLRTRRRFVSWDQRLPPENWWYAYWAPGRLPWT